MSAISVSSIDPVELLINNAKDIDHASRALKAMGHPLRLKILCILVRQEEIVLRAGVQSEHQHEVDPPRHDEAQRVGAPSAAPGDRR